MRMGSLSRTHLVAAALALGGLLLWSYPSGAQVSDDESKCQVGTSLALSKFVRQKAKCLMACYRGAQEGKNPTSDCVSPFGGSTHGCVQQAESDTKGLGQTKCSKDCPECYTGGDCQADMDGRVVATEAHVDSLLAQVFCDDSGSTDGLNPAEAKCQIGLAKALSKFTATKMKCLAKCRKAEHFGKIPPNSCNPPNPTDPKTVECITKAETKYPLKIDKYCETSSLNPSADKPECGLYPTTNGAGWVAGEEADVDANDPGLYCGS